MIIWLASYPKSGNTWVRIFLTSIIYNQNNIALNQKIFDKIRNYPLVDLDFSKYLKEKFTNIVTTDKDNEIKELFYKNWITSQQRINFENKISILKTHNMLCKIEENKFTDLENSIGVIHIVRDPRNVITSLKNHYSKKNYEETKKQIFDEYRWIGINNKLNYIPTFTGSWKTNYLSWKRFPKNYILVKYEDLLLDPKKEFKKIIEYLKQFFDLNISDEKIEEHIEKVSFKNLEKLERDGIFKESVKDESGNLKKFFYLGPKNNWEKILDKKIADEISSKFEPEMKELGYL